MDNNADIPFEIELMALGLAIVIIRLDISQCTSINGYWKVSEIVSIINNMKISCVVQDDFYIDESFIAYGIHIFQGALKNKFNWVVSRRDRMLRINAVGLYPRLEYGYTVKISGNHPNSEECNPIQHRLPIFKSITSSSIANDENIIKELNHRINTIKLLLLAYSTKTKFLPANSSSSRYISNEY